MASVGSKISTTDYNNIQEIVERTLGPSSAGTPTFGYGQTVRSSQVGTNDTVSANDIANLRADLVNIGVHQTGNVPSDAAGSTNLKSVAEGDKVRYSATGQPVDQYNTFASTAQTNRFTISNSYAQTFQIDSGISRFWDASQGETWGGGGSGVETTVSLQWNNAALARHWFNSGSKLLFSSSRTGGTTSTNSQTIGPQNQAWSDFLDNTVGTREFLASNQTTPLNGTDFYRLSSNYQVFYTASLSSPYADSYFEIAARAPSGLPRDGTATAIDIRVRWIDNHVPILDSPVDGVDGTLALNVSVFEPIQILLPSGSWTVTTPSISNTPTITVI